MAGTWAAVAGTMRNEVDMIAIFVTGGTFDKTYDEIAGRLAFADTHLPEMLRLGRCHLDVSVRTVMMVDSLDMTDSDRSLIVDQCRQAAESRILITHGTDTMVETARAIAPFIPLAEMLGRFFAQFARSGFREITLEVAGDLAGHDVSPLAAAALRGMLETTTTERVNLVNATHLAKARGIAVPEGGLKIPTGIAYPVLLLIGIAIAMTISVRHGTIRRRWPTRSA